MATVTAAGQPTATLDDLRNHEGKAELVGGKILPLMPTGRMPAYAAGEVFAALRLYVRRAGCTGIAVLDNAGFSVNLPGRKSFSPDAAYDDGPRSGMGFFEGAPDFAVEVRSEGVSAEEGMTSKRLDYFSAGTQVVWDVDLLSDEAIVRKFTASGGADVPVATFGRGEVADAEPAVPGWTMPVDDLFEP